MEVAVTVDRALDRLLREERRAARTTKPNRPQSYWRRHRLQKCGCGGYWFPHRKGGGACDFSPRADYYRAIRDGATVPEAQLLLSVDQLERMFPLPPVPAGDTAEELERDNPFNAWMFP